MMKHMLLGVVGALAFAGSAVAEVPTVSPVPMAQDNMPAVGEFSYQSGGVLPLPLITWGADLATIHGNGDAASTQAGSIFGRAGLSVDLYREDTFREQVRAYLRGDTPILRGTTGMITAAMEVLDKDPRTRPQVFYNLSRSAGGDSMVAQSGINTLGDLRGKSVCLQADGPHMDLLDASLRSAGMSVSEVTVKWYADLGFDGNASAAHAFQAGECDAAFVIFPDMLELLEGDGAVAGAKEIFSTANMDRVIYDVYAVRSDFASAHPEVIESLSNALMRANESLKAIVARGGDPSLETHESRDADYRKAAAAGASLLFGVDGDITFDNTVMEMYKFDLKMQGWTGNVNFMTEPQGVQGAVWLGSLAQNAQSALSTLGLMTGAEMVSLAAYSHDYEALKAGLTEQFGVEAPRIDAEAAARVVESLAVEDLQDRTITELVITFAANQTEFSAALYAAEFDRVLQAMAPSSGPVVVVTGHSGTYNYLVKKFGKNAQPPEVWSEIAQSAVNLSRARAETVIVALKDYAAQNGYDVSFEGVVPVGRGITEPAGGMCSWTLKSSGQKVMDPCGPENKGDGAAWEANEAAERRVIFRVVNVASEAEVFTDDAF